MKDHKIIASLGSDWHRNWEVQMLTRDGYCLRTEIDGLFPGRPEPLVPKKVADLLQSHLISGFETALEQGLHPSDALALILCWASSELVRVRQDQTR